MTNDYGLTTLLELHGVVIEQEKGCWMKFEAQRVEPSAGIPHGIKYALTLHDRHGTRLLGFDNAHAIKPPKKFKYAGRNLPLIMCINTRRTRASIMNSRRLTSC